MAIFVIYLALYLALLVHELGHFYFAYNFKAGIENLTIGIGPKIACFRFRWTRINLRLIPYFGFVLFRKTEDCVFHETPYEYLKYYQKIVINIAGPLANFVLAWFSILILESKYYIVSIPELIKSSSIYFIDLIKLNYFEIITGFGLKGFETSYGTAKHFAFHISDPTYGFYITLFIWFSVWVNIVLGISNLIPIFPLDGGSCVSDTIELFTPEKGKRRAVLKAYQYIGLFAVSLYTVVILSKDLLSGLKTLIFG